MADIILGYVIIGLILSALYIRKRKNGNDALTIAVITFLWFPVIIFSFIVTFIRLVRELKSEDASDE